MAKRRVNSLLGRSAGYLGLDHYTTVMVCLAIPAAFVAFSITKNLIPAIISALAVGAIFQLVTNGKPGVFYNSLFKRPHWVRGERKYINTWSHEYTPEASSISYSSSAFLWCGLSYIIICAFFKPFVVLGLLLFALPLVPWSRFFKKS